MNFIKKKLIERCIYDPNFKSIFIENPNALAHLISSVTGIDYYLLKNNLTIKVNEIPINSKDEKFKKTDFIINVDNYTINIEANSSYNDLFKVKNTSYIMELYSENTRKGKDYNPNLVFIQINLNAFNTNGKSLTEYYISDPKTGEIYLENFIFYVLDIAKCYKLFYNLDEEKITDNIRWGAFLYSDNLNELNNIIGNMLDDKDKQKLIWKVEDINMRKDGTLTKREAEEWGRWIENSLKKEGYEDGVINTIKSMLKKEMSYEDISDITNKTIEQIKEIENSMKE